MKIEVFKRLRLIYGYSANEFSNLIGYSKSYLSEIENGSKSPTIDFIEKSAKVYGIKPSSLLMLTEEMQEENSNGKVFVKKMMENLIIKMSKDFGDDANSTDEV